MFHFFDLLFSFSDFILYLSGLNYGHTFTIFHSFFEKVRLKQKKGGLYPEAAFVIQYL
ncbi:hypothetical protein CHK_1498 [Christensenella hongkongensis]|uniref:Uncharacterized protein n=1 Tax=Christensenella hongkongensis TaxID=270498 RepID=A0A0M2NJG8_9FIRM|nr:hypothetical protein CHK_1498 [Christensenella hongkongensis]